MVASLIFPFLNRVVSIIFLSLSLLVISIGALGQANSKKIIAAFQDYSSSNLQEKIYVHLDRPDHLTGEILWFKIYCVDARMHRPLDLSKIAYAEILDLSNKPILQTKVALENGIGTGSFFIPATITTGPYLFRAYTSWMKNSGSEFFFQQPITIINTLKANEVAAAPPQTSLDIRFYPEGGHLVENITSRVAFQVMDNKGKGIDCHGAIINQVNDTIVKFKTLKFGIGSFMFVPKSGAQYRSIIYDSKHLAIQTTLPPVSETGYVLMVSDTLGEKIKVTVRGNRTPFIAQLFVHTRQSIKVTEVKTAMQSVIEFIIDRNKLGDGISHFTILDGDNNPVCERLYFKKPDRIFDISLQADQKEYAVRRKVRLTLQSGQPNSGNLSVSVFRADSVSTHSNIVSNLFLSSDLAGEVESPEYYFTDDSLASLAADNLMLTHGWRRFKWESVFSEKLTIVQHLPELKGHLIQGKIVDNAGKKASGKIGYLASPEKKIQLYVSRSDTSGKVLFQMKDFQETGKIIALTNYETDSLFHIEIENPFSSSFSKWKAEDVMVSASQTETLLNRSIAMQVQDAFYEDETYFHFVNVAFDSLPFYGKADEVYNLDDYTRFTVMEEVMREYVKGVWVRKKKDTFRFMVIDKLNNGVFQDNPLTLLDGVPVFNINQVLDIDPLKVKKLEVLTRKYFFGPLELQGIVSFSTYNGDLGGFQLDPKSITLDYEGLQHQREFYHPNYTDPAARGSRLPDQRHLLYWNPNVKLIPGKATTLEFYTSDVEGKFIIEVEGLTDNGKPGFSRGGFKVSR